MERQDVLDREPNRLRLFMATSGRMLSALLPPAAGDWLRVAERYREGAASAADLARARVAAWEHLGKESCNFQSPPVLAVRAVICLLFPDDYWRGERWFDIVDFFLHMSNQAADHRREQCQLLRSLFPEYLGPSNPSA